MDEWLDEDDRGIIVIAYAYAYAACNPRIDETLQLPMRVPYIHFYIDRV
jgi:hypothetical protein